METVSGHSTVLKRGCQRKGKEKSFTTISKDPIASIPLQNGLKQFSRTVFWDSTALRLSYNCINVDALRELGIILFAWHFRTPSSSTPL
jgi:hypothetical protein